MTKAQHRAPDGWAAPSTAEEHAAASGVAIAGARARRVEPTWPNDDPAPIAHADSELDCAPMMILRLDAEGRVNHVNEAWRQFVRQSGAPRPPADGLGQRYLELVQAVSGRGPDEVTLGAGFDLLRLAATFASVQTLLPALLLVIVGEVARIRSALYYVIGGGATLAVVPLMARLGEPLTVLDLSPVVWQVLATAGFAGGFVYWLLAGRNT